MRDFTPHDFTIDALPDDLDPYEPLLRKIWPEGRDLYLSRHGNQRATMTIPGERRVLNDCLRETAKRIFPNNCLEAEDKFLIRLPNYRVKIKKHSQKYTTANYPTIQVKLFLDQEPIDPYMGDLFSDLQPINLQLGYIPGDGDINNWPAVLTKPNGRKTPDWIYEFPEYPIQGNAPIPPAPPVDGTPKPIVTPRRSDVPETGKESKEVK